MNVVIYARFSSHSQTEQSIEGQLKVCYEYAESNHYTVVGEYIDRAISGTTDNRAEFQRMISDSDRHTFEGVLVYQLDRFARNRYDSAINKAKLKKNGVRVLSAKENIADDASGILVEGVLESMAEYYSVELSQKIHRGMAINAEKCLSNGSNPGLGFKVDAERRFYVDEEEAAIVREIYERYASGETKAEIIRDLKRRRVKTSLGKEFSPNSLSHLLSNKRYIGVYLYKGKETPGGMPRILDDDLFYRVQSMMNKNKNAPARTHGEGEYLLTTKLFCGHCKEMMVGYGGTSKTGRQYHYYMCKNARRKKCGKKIVSKSYIEDRVVNECLKMLTEEKIRFIAKKVADECAKSPDNLTAKALKKAIREADTAIENLWKAIEQGRAVEMLTDRLNKRMAEKAELEAQLAIEENKKITLTEAQILAFLDYVCEMPADDVNKRRAIINIFVHSIYLYDDHFTLIINASKKPLSIDNIPLDDIETAFEGETGASEGCSSLSTPAPPAASCRSQFAHLTLWGALFFAPAFPIGGVPAPLTPAAPHASPLPQRPRKGKRGLRRLTRWKPSFSLLSAHSLLPVFLQNPFQGRGPLLGQQMERGPAPAHIISQHGHRRLDHRAGAPILKALPERGQALLLPLGALPVPGEKPVIEGDQRAGVHVGAPGYGPFSPAAQAVQDQSVVAGEDREVPSFANLQIGQHAVPVPGRILDAHNIGKLGQPRHCLGQKGIPRAGRDVVEQNGQIHRPGHGGIVVIEFLLAGSPKAGGDDAEHIGPFLTGHAGLGDGLPRGDTACPRIHRDPSPHLADGGFQNLAFLPAVQGIALPVGAKAKNPMHAAFQQPLHLAAQLLQVDLLVRAHRGDDGRDDAFYLYRLHSFFLLLSLQPAGRILCF